MEDVVFSPEKILQFLHFLNSKLTNIKSITLDFEENRNLIYDKRKKDFNFPFDSFSDFVSYKEKLSSYKEKAKVKLNHRINFEMFYAAHNLVEIFLEKFKNEFWDFEYSSEVKYKLIYYDFKKSMNITDDFALDVGFRFVYFDDNNKTDDEDESGEEGEDTDDEVVDNYEDRSMDGYEYESEVSRMENKEDTEEDD